MIDLGSLREIIFGNGLVVKNDNWDETECLMNIADDLEELYPKNTWIKCNENPPNVGDTVVGYCEEEGILLGIVNRIDTEFYNEDPYSSSSYKFAVLEGINDDEYVGCVSLWIPVPKIPD